MPPRSNSPICERSLDLTLIEIGRRDIPQCSPKHFFTQLFYRTFSGGQRPRSVDSFPAGAVYANASAVRDHRRVRRSARAVPATTPESESYALGARSLKDGHLEEEGAGRLLPAAAFACLLPLESHGSSRTSRRRFRQGGNQALQPR